MYCRNNFATKKALKDAVKNGAKLSIFQPNDMFGNGNPKDGNFTVEGPHYPKPHSWYASVQLKDGFIVSVK